MCCEIMRSDPCGPPYIPDSPSVCMCGCSFTVDHPMICQRGGLIIQRHDEICDLEAELQNIACYDVAIEPTFQPLAGEELCRGSKYSTRCTSRCALSWILG